MSKREKIYLRVVKGSLVPADPVQAAKLRDRRYHMNDLVLADITKPRNPKFNKLVHQLGQLVVQKIDAFSCLDAHKAIKRLQIEGRIACDEIGVMVANSATALGMKVIAHDPYVSPESVPDYVTLVSFDELLAQSDALSVHCPLSESTRYILNEQKLGLMKPSAYLINTARGSIVDEAALDKMLAEKRLAGAAMDVFSVEPGSPSHPLFRHENFLCTPHMAWHSEESAKELKRKAAEEVRRVLLGEKPLYQVNAF